MILLAAAHITQLIFHSKKRKGKTIQAHIDKNSDRGHWSLLHCKKNL